MDKKESKADSKVRQLRSVAFSMSRLRSKAAYKEVSAGEIIGMAQLLIKKFDYIFASIDLKDEEEKEEIELVKLSRAMLEKYISVLRKCESVFEDSEAATAWLRAANTAMGVNTPLEKMRSDDGIDLVINELGRIQHGIVS